MASAHVTSTVGEDSAQPSIFEVLAQDGLMSLLQPAVKHALRIWAEKNPAKFGWLYGFGDELYLLMDLIVEQYYLKHYSASFAENFYGIKRVSLLGEKLSKSNRFKSLLCLVLLPYVKIKCEQTYDRLSDPQNAARQRNQARVWNIFRAVYPYVHGLYEGAMLYFQLAYTFSKSRYHSPLLRLAGVRLTNITEEDMQLFADPASNTSSHGGIYSLLRRGLGATAVGLSSGLSVAVFFIQFLEWWYASDQQATSLTALPTPPPPSQQQQQQQQQPQQQQQQQQQPQQQQQQSAVKVPRLTSICPLCQRLRTNDTALSVSGYVFCYPCIYKHLQRTSACPVTCYPATSEHLVKLFIDDV